MSTSKIHIFYSRHKSLGINLFAMLIYLMLSQALGKKGLNNLNETPWVALLFIFTFLLEPWATSYSMRAFHARKERFDIKTIKLQKWMNKNYFLMILFWGIRLALFGVLLAMSLKTIKIPDIFQNQIVGVLFIMSLMFREGFIIYYMVREKPKHGFKESYDFLADIILAIMLVFGQLAVGEIFRDMGMKGIDHLSDMGKYPLVVLFFILLFYLPVRYINTIEDLTFARTWPEKIERLIAMLVLLIGFLLAF